MEIKKILTGLKTKYETKTGKKALYNKDLVNIDFMFYVVEFYENASAEVLKQLKEYKKNNELSENL